ncbi:MAG: phosphotransferase [Defluviitaleaceae bacterium]|nr:phosphotransferase [Defluviitaleaceae bacterium]
MDNIICKILTHWDIPQDIPLREINENDGVHDLGHIWFVGERYVLKKWKNEALETQAVNFSVAKALGPYKLAAAPLHTKIGEWVVHCANGDAFYTLTPYMPGKTLTDDEIKSDEMPAKAHKIGQALAKLHRALATLEGDIKVNDANMYKTVTEWAIPKTMEANEKFNMGLDEAIFADYAATFSKLYSQLPKQLIHRDAHTGNIIFNAGEVSGFIDFAIGERNVRLRDVCYCLTGMASAFYDHPEKWFALIRNMLTGYHQINPLTSAEKQSAFFVMCSIQFICVAFFAGKDEYKQAWEQNRVLTPFVIKHKDRIMEICLSV